MIWKRNVSPAGAGGAGLAFAQCPAKTWNSPDGQILPGRSG